MCILITVWHQSVLYVSRRSQLFGGCPWYACLCGIFNIVSYGNISHMILLLIHISGDKAGQFCINVLPFYFSDNYLLLP